MEQMHQYIQDPSQAGMQTAGPFMTQSGPALSPYPPSPMMPGPSVVQPGVGGPVFPGPTPSPWPPSPMMPGPTMQPPGAPGPVPDAMAHGMAPGDASPQSAPDGGHSCGCKTGSHSHPGDPSVHPGISPAAMPRDYLYEAYQYGPAYYSPAIGEPQFASPADSQWLGMNFRDDQFWKGVLLGAAVTLIFTSEAVQKTLIKGTASVWTAAQSGVEEVKEKFEDIKAELKQKSEKKK
ncbi:MAG: hypothetical protein LWX01_05345 [Deltaproteobacteria bacterium]|nr:hypothetical protein [Deltaproteobacteria bacterium]MDL1961113.1 hypothetical protein [Deltaproteobacteria bacterium]